MTVPAQRNSFEHSLGRDCIARAGAAKRNHYE